MDTQIIKELWNGFLEKSSVLSKSPEFFQEEISWIKGKLFIDENEYLDAKRIGRGTSDRITKKDKIVIWKVYNRYNEELQNRGKVDFDDYAILSLNKINNTSHNGTAEIKSQIACHIIYYLTLQTYDIILQNLTFTSKKCINLSLLKTYVISFFLFHCTNN